MGGYTTSSWEGHINTLRSQLESQDFNKYTAHFKRLLKNVIYINESTTVAMMYAFASRRGFTYPDTSVPRSMPTLSQRILSEILDDRGLRRGSDEVRVTMKQMYDLDRMTMQDI